MKITITGTSGFVGKNLIPYLESRLFEVNSLSMRNPDWIQQFPLKSDVLIHLAGKAHDTSNTDAEEEYFQVNRDLTIALFQQFLKSDIKDFFYFSSVKAVADRVEGILTEDVSGNPQTAYGRSKWEAEQFLLKQQLPTGKRLFIIRPCMIHGPGNKGNLNLLYKVVKNGIPWPLAAFSNERSFLSIDNLNYLIAEMILHKETASGVYHFSDDDALSTNELILLINKTLGKKAKLWNISKKMIEKTAKMGDFLYLPLNSERLKKLTESYRVSNNKIKSELGINSLPLTVQEGLQRTVKSFDK